MKSSELIPSLEIIKFNGPLNLDVSGITCDSRKVKHGDVFVAVKGLKTDGHLFAREAVKRGAVGVVVENWLDLPEETGQIQVKDTRKVLSYLSDLIYVKPTVNLKLIGVTGTNGKTTTTYLLESIFAAQNRKTGLIGTVEYRIGKEILPVERTTPEACELHKIFSEMVKSGVEVAVMEVSSHAIDLHRVDHCRFDVAIFTNLSQEHLDYHETMEEYFKVKSRLFENSFEKNTIHVVNLDDPYGQKIISSSVSRVITYGFNEKSDVKAIEVRLSEKGSEYIVSTSTGDLQIELQLGGTHNIYNSLAAIAAAKAMEVPDEIIKKGLKEVAKIPGRFEIIDGVPNYEATVIVDYAHTPDSLEKAIKAAKEIAKGRVITVFGCGGDRDKFKRPKMGEVSAKLSDFTILTSDNPRSEEIEKIIDEIKTGFERVKKDDYLSIFDRREAIVTALEMAKKGDFVIIAGKGHERVQMFRDKTLPFSDQEVAREAMRRISQCFS